jgi:phage/plasmid-associated DNA primase
LRVDQLKQRFETSRLIGKMLLTVIEAPADFLNQDGAEIVKALVGHDEMKGERKNVNESLRVQGRYPIVVTSNEELRVRLAGDESAWARRLLNVDYRRPRPNGSKIIDNFHEILLREEGPGILNWMINGALVHWQELQAQKGFQISQQQIKRVENILLRSKSVEVCLSQQSFSLN